jgi:hypothetical protein
MAMGAASGSAIDRRVEAIDWPRVAAELDARGCAVVDAILSPAACHSVAGFYDDESRFRSRRDVEARLRQRRIHDFSYPLPAIVSELRAALPAPRPLASRWNEAMGIDVRYPERHADFAGAMPPVSPGRRRCSSATVRTTTTACTRICMASMSFRFRLRACWRSPARSSPAASSC